MSIIPAQKVRRKQEKSAAKTRQISFIGSNLKFLKLFGHSSKTKNNPSTLSKITVAGIFGSLVLIFGVPLVFTKVTNMFEKELYSLPLSIELPNSPFQDDAMLVQSISNLLQQCHLKNQNFRQFKSQLNSVIKSERSISEFKARLTADRKLHIQYKKEIPYIVIRGSENKPTILSKSGKFLGFKNSASVKLPTLYLPNQKILSSKVNEDDLQNPIDEPIIINKPWFLDNYSKILNSLPKNTTYNPTIHEMEWYQETGFEVDIQMSYSTTVRIILGTKDYAVKLERMLEIWKDLNLKQVTASEINLADVNKAIVKTIGEKKKFSAL